MSTLPDYQALGQTDEEEALLREHDEGEDLHAFVPTALPDLEFMCKACGDTAEGLMHNNTWRSVEPLLDAQEA